MARFPIAESEIMALAEAMTAGLMANGGTYPAPPVIGPAFATLRSGYLNARDDVIAARAAAEQATAAKDTALEYLVDAMKSNLRYAENTVKNDDTQLKMIGWGGRRAAKALAAPGQSQLLEAPRQGEGWVVLDWKAPADGGRPAAYKVLRRERPAGAWQEAATAIESESTLIDQPRGRELEYRVTAVNKSGEGEPSNTVMVVL